MGSNFSNPSRYYVPSRAFHPSLLHLDIPGPRTPHQHRYTRCVETQPTHGCRNIAIGGNPDVEEVAHHVPASRALVYERLGRWDAALVDAKEVHIALLSHTRALTPFGIKSIKIQQSFVGHVAECVALVGEVEKDSGCLVCDIASLCFPSPHQGT